MKIELNGGEKGEPKLVFTDEESENRNFVSIFFGEDEFCVDLDELLSTAHAFEQMRLMQHERQKRLLKEEKLQSNS